MGRRKGPGKGYRGRAGTGLAVGDVAGKRRGWRGSGCGRVGAMVCLLTLGAGMVGTRISLSILAGDGKGDVQTCLPTYPFN